MNKEKLLELSDTLRGIAEGEEWEYCCFIGPNEQWFSSMTGTDPLSMVARGQNIRLKPQPLPPDPYAELKAAHAAGETIQFRLGEGFAWRDDEAKTPAFGEAGIMFRRKPEPRKVPLGSDDVPPSSVIRPVGWIGDEYVNIEAVVHNGIRMIEDDWGGFVAEHGYMPWIDLMAEWRINRSIPLTGKWDKDAWEPCYKEVSE